MEVKVTCCRTVFHTASGQLFSLGSSYKLEPIAELAEFFLWEPELRAKLREQRAKFLGKAVPDAKKLEEADARKLADIAHTRIVPSKEPRTLHEMTPKPPTTSLDAPIALSQLNPDFLG